MSEGPGLKPSRSTDGMTNFAFLGHARSGKDTAAHRLVTAHHYVPLAFATPLKTAAEKLNPIISFGNLTEVRLLDALAEFGWEGTKDAYPEARRILQNMGQGVRDLDPGFWTRILANKVREYRRNGASIVVTDVRYENEAKVLQHFGFKLVRVVRPSIFGRYSGSFHQSETGIPFHLAEYQLANTGTVADLHSAVDDMVTAYRNME